MEVLKVQKWNHRAASGPGSGRLSSGDSSTVSQRPLQPLVCRSAIPEAWRTPRGMGGEAVECVRWTLLSCQEGDPASATVWLDLELSSDETTQTDGLACGWDLRKLSL